MSQEKLIDIIIPAYKAQKTIVRALSSIACQTIIDKISVTIVNDADGIGYEEYVNDFSKYFKIKEIVMPNNGGPGVARQYGMDNTSNEFLTFMDADDAYNGPFVFEILLETMNKYPKCNMVVPSFYEHQSIPNFNLSIHERSLVWVFGKLYRKSYINDKNIRFNETRANEDVGFNTLFDLCLPGQDEQEVVFLPEPMYSWIENQNSITRVDNFSYIYAKNLPGFVENEIYAIKGAEERTPENKNKINEKKIEVMVNLYYIYCGAFAFNEKNKKGNIFACVRFYNEIFKDYESEIDKEFLNKRMTHHSNLRLNMLKDLMPELTFMQWFNAIRRAPYDPRMQID